MSDDKKAIPPAERSPEGGQKDTDNLDGIKDVQKTGMLQKSKQVDQLPEEVKGTDPGLPPQKR